MENTVEAGPMCSCRNAMRERQTSPATHDHETLESLREQAAEGLLTLGERMYWARLAAQTVRARIDDGDIREAEHRARFAADMLRSAL